VAGEVDYREQHVAHLQGHLVTAPGVQRLLDLVQLLAELGEDRAGLAPVEAGPRRPLLELERAGEGGQRQGNVREQARVAPGLGLGGPLGGLRVLPDRVRGRGVGDLASPKTCGWRATILAATPRATRSKSNRPCSSAIRA
jgi:hypothetical protein